MDSKKATQKATSIFSAKPNGREKSYMESIYWGVAKPYADITDCRKAGIRIDKKKVSPGGAYYYITKSECAVLVKWLNK